MKIVMTGGPSVGKTAMIDLFALSHAKKLCTVPEAAAILFKGGYPRRYAPALLKCQERAVYYLQRELERAAEWMADHKAILCDRGSLDGLAYWPGEESEYFTQIGSSMEEELLRYDCVIHLEPAPDEGYTISDCNESEQNITDINEKVRHAWRLHKNRHLIAHEGDFMWRVSQVKTLIEVELMRKQVRLRDFTRMA